MRHWCDSYCLSNNDHWPRHSQLTKPCPATHTEFVSARARLLSCRQNSSTLKKDVPLCSLWGSFGTLVSHDNSSSTSIMMAPMIRNVMSVTHSVMARKKEAFFIVRPSPKLQIMKWWEEIMPYRTADILQLPTRTTIHLIEEHAPIIRYHTPRLTVVSDA